MILLSTQTNEIFLDGIVGADWTGEGITAIDLGESLKKIKGRATIRINSPGGSADEGIAIYNMLKRHPGGVDTHNEALAASAASVIFLAGERRTMERGSKLMIHRAHMIAIGNQSQMAKAQELLALYDDDMAKLYSEHMGMSEEEVVKLMDEETWYDAEGAVGNGLATHMAPTVRKKAAAAAAWFKHPPQDLFEQCSAEKAGEETRRTYLKLCEMRLKLQRQD
jgi:ATP-dependent Clp protease protease subunit